MLRWLLVVGFACSGDRPAPPATRPPAAPIADALGVDAGPLAVDAGPRTVDEALAALRSRNLAAAAAVIAARIAQSKPKMRLTSDEGLRAALALLDVADRTPFRELHAVMPRSTVELARAVRERGVAIDDADAIASYLVRVVAALRFERLATFDDNHSHVTGREWNEIDYSGEGMTWQSQQSDWSPRGVTSFKRAQYIHAYFVGAERLPHWKRVYKPRGRMAEVSAP